MAERRKGRKKKEQEVKEEEPKPSKIEYAVAKYIRDKLPEKKTTLLSHKVEYFIASKAVDCLLDSPWASGKSKGENVFTNRESVVSFMDQMLRHKFFHRAKKIIVQKEGKKKKKKDQEKEEITVTEDSKDTKEKEQKTKEKKEKKAEYEKEEKKDKDAKGADKEKKKEKKKFKLDMHLEQVYVDGNEAYVWIYDPIPVRAWIIGTLMVVGAVLVCLFPLWPKTVRHYVYYLSVAAAGFLVFIIGLAVVRLILFVIIWLVTFGKHHLWLLPNLTEDVGFFESFWPLYKYEYKGKSKKDKDDDDDKEEKDDKEDDDESKDQQPKDQDKEESTTDQEGREPEDQLHTDSEQESEGDKSKTENGDNGFEIVDPDEEMEEEEEEKQ